MRKALMGLIMAATVMTPIAAEAQNRDRERGRGGRAERVQRAEQRGQDRVERQEQRSERREQRQEARQQVRAERRQPAQAERRQQRQQGQVERRQQRQQVQVIDRRGGRQSDYPGAWQGNPNDPRREHYERLERRNQYRYGTSEQRRDVRQEVREERRGDRRDRRDDRRDWRDDRRDWRSDRRDDRRDWRSDRRDWRRDWNRDWRRDNRYDWSSWRYRNRNLFRGSRYYSPYRNHRYSRFSIGFFLEPLFFSQRYWIGDPFHYRLPPAPPGTQWIRYYNDVLLVDTWSGEVVDVIYDFFW